MRPQPIETSGQYRISVATGIIAAGLAAGSQLLQFKWAPAAAQQNKRAIIQKVRVRFLGLTPFTAATLTDHTSVDAFVARSYALGGGGTTLTLTGDNAKMRTRFETSAAVINVATTAALTAATTLDAQPFAASVRKGNRVNPAAATEEIVMPYNDELYFEPKLSDGEIPLTLENKEGFVISNRTVWPAAGTGIYLFDILWSESVTPPA